MPASVIDPATFEDEWFGQLTDREMLIWIGVFSRLRDDQGRFVENAALARSRLWPYRDIPVSDVQDAFDRFVKDNRLHRYDDGEHVLLQIVTWWEHQRPQWAAPSKLPSPEGWTDRVRTRLSGTYHAVNWDSPGGFTRMLQVNGSGEGVQVNASGGPFGLAHEPEPEPNTEPFKATPLPPDPVHNSAEPERDDSHESEERVSVAPDTDKAGALEALRHNPTCDGEDCAVRTLRVAIRGAIGEIVGRDQAGNLYNDSTPLHKTLAGMAGYICAACWKASAAATMPERQPLCRKALVAYIEGLAAFHREKPIRSLPAFLRTRYGNMSEAPVSDELLAELRALEHQPQERAEGGEPRRIGEIISDELLAAQSFPSCI